MKRRRDRCLGHVFPSEQELLLRHFSLGKEAELTKEGGNTEPFLMAFTQGTVGMQKVRSGTSVVARRIPEHQVWGAEMRNTSYAFRVTQWEEGDTEDTIISSLGCTLRICAYPHSRWL